MAKTASQQTRAKYWPEVEQFFGNLPPALFQLGALLKNNLAILYSDSGRFEDILCRRQDYPLLELHLWLLDDWGVAGDERRAGLEQHLLVGMALAAAAGYAHDCLLDQTSAFDNRLALLEHALVRQSAVHFAHLFPGPSPFWSYYQGCWDDYAEACLSGFVGQGERLPARVETGAARPGDRLAPAKIPVVAVALKAGREAELPQLLAMIDGLNAIFQVRRDLLAFRVDLLRGHYTYPILRTMAEAGIDLQQPVVPERVLGALLLAGTGRQLCHESLARLESCRAVAAVLNLPTFSAYFDTVEALIDSLLDLFSIRRQADATKKDRPRPEVGPVSFAPYADPLPRAVRMAEGYLLADPTFRESWDVQRGGFLDAPELTARAFPAGLIVEILCRHGHHLPERVDDIFELLRASRFQYYDHPRAALPDADDLGLLLRLYRFSARQAAHRDMLQTPLAWMGQSVLPSGEVPVWFRPDNLPAEEEGPAVLIWGSSCATTEANLLLGLIDYDWPGYEALIERAALNLFERLLARGLGATLYYLPPYSLWAMFKLIAELSSRPVPTELRDRLAQVSELLLARFELETQRRQLTPQDAAFLTLCCAYPPAGPLFDPGWITTLLKSQRHDGSWDDEPLFLIPDRNLTCWYSSRSVTTAFCYHALRTYLASGRAA